jgi:hypothetical protein
MKSYVLFAISLILASCSQSPTSPVNNFQPVRPKTAEELRRELKVSEQRAPYTYLSAVNFTLEPNEVHGAGLFRKAKYDGYMLRGIIKSSATIARFKDATMHVTYLTETNTTIGVEDVVLYEYVNPSGSADFSMKVNPPSTMKTFSVSVTGATAVD